MWVFLLGIVIALIAAIFGAFAKKAGEKYILFNEKKLIRQYKIKIKIAYISFILTFMIPIILSFTYYLFDFNFGIFITTFIVIFIVTGILLGMTSIINIIQLKKLIKKGL